MPIVFPKTQRPDEFLAAEHLRALLGPNSLDVANRIGVRLARLDEVIMGSASWTPVQYPAAIFNRGGVWERDVSQTRITIPEEGLWLFGANVKLDDIAVATPNFRFSRIRLNSNYQVARVGAVDGSSNVRSRLLVWGTWYAFPGDYVEAEFWQNSGEDVQILATLEDVEDLTSYSPTFWAVKLTGRRTKETWTAPATKAAPDVPSVTEFDDVLNKDVRFLRSPPFVRATRHETTQSIGDTTWVPKVKFDTLDADNNSFFVPNAGGFTDGSTDRLTVNRAGIYLVGGCLDWAKNANGQRHARITRTRAGVETVVARCGGHPAKNAVGAGTQVSLIGLHNFAAGDTIELRGWHNVGSPITTRAMREYAPLLWAVRVGENVAAGTLVTPHDFDRLGAFTHTLWNDKIKALLDYHYAPPAVRCLKTGNQSIGRNNWSKLVWGTEDFDTDGMHSTVSNTSRITFNDEGLYLVGGHAGFAADATGRYLSRLYVTRPTGSDAFTDAIVAEHGPLLGHGSAGACLPVVTLWRAKAGDYAELAARPDAGTGTINSNDNGGESVCDFWAVRLGS